MKTEQEIRRAIKNLYEATYGPRTDEVSEYTKEANFARIITLCHVIGILPQMEKRVEEAMWDGNFRAADFIKEMEYRSLSFEDQEKTSDEFLAVLKGLLEEQRGRT
jgi:hypothetical protein